MSDLGDVSEYYQARRSIYQRTYVDGLQRIMLYHNIDMVAPTDSWVCCLSTLTFQHCLQLLPSSCNAYLP